MNVDLAVLDPTTRPPVGYRIVTTSGRRRREWPIQFRSLGRANDFAKSIRQARPNADVEIEPVYSKRIEDRRDGVMALVPLVERVGEQRLYRCPSRSEPGHSHVIWTDRKGELHCNCTAGARGSLCDHILAVCVVEEAIAAEG